MIEDDYEKELRDLVAMFAMAALLIRNKYDSHPHEQAFVIADQFMKARNETTQRPT
jgi:hypothetical protein